MWEILTVIVAGTNNTVCWFEWSNY